MRFHPANRDDGIRLLVGGPVEIDRRLVLDLAEQNRFHARLDWATDILFGYPVMCEKRRLTSSGRPNDFGDAVDPAAAGGQRDARSPSDRGADLGLLKLGGDRRGDIVNF